MTNKPRTVYLGQEAFFLYQGQVVRTAVGRLYEGGYSFLDNRCPLGRHWFTYDQAVSEAGKGLVLRQETLRRQLKELESLRKKLKTPLYKEKVLTAPRRVRDLRDTENPSRTRNLKRLKVPENYHNPGEVVYLVVLPQTQTQMEYVYRPYDYFVLETVVGTVCIAPDGKLNYWLRAAFEWKEFFLSRDKATTSLRSAAKLKINDTVHFVSKEEYKTETDKINNVPF